MQFHLLSKEGMGQNGKKLDRGHLGKSIPPDNFFQKKKKKKERKKKKEGKS